MNRIYLILCLLVSQISLQAQNDTIPPDITCPIPDTVTLGPGGDCTFQYFYTVVSSDNEPGDTLVQLSGLESGSNFPLGNTINVFQAIDAAGNTASCSFQLTVQNYAGPLVCKNDITVSLDSTCAWTPKASDLLTGNVGCTDSAYYVLEVDKEAPSGNGPWLPAEFGSGDVGKTYVFRVLDTIFGYNCTGTIQITDLLPPLLTCDSFVISCAVDNVSPYFLKDSLGIGVAVPTATDGCTPIMDLQHLDSTVPMDCTSGFVGAINRKWTAYDGFSNSSSCIQSIKLTRPVISDLQYPPDITIGCANPDVSTDRTGQPYLEFAGRKWTNTCSLGTAFNDSTIQISTCSKQVLRTWFVIDWCNGDALEKVQVIDIQDTIGPSFLNCPDSTLTFGDTSATNDPALWNAPHWTNPQSGMENLCESPAALEVAVVESCSGIPADIKYILFLDLDNNGNQETVVRSDDPPAAGTVNFGNAANPNYAGGESRSFDERPVDSILKYRFALQKIATGDTLTCRVAWNTDSMPSQFSTPQLPYGKHTIRWITQDSCDNEAVCEYDFTIKDARPPSVVCADTVLTVNISPLGFFVLFLQDLSFTAIDNCTPSDSLQFGIRRAGTGTGFPVDASGDPIVDVTFLCFQDFGEQQVEVWGKDRAGNADFCIATVDIQDPDGLCEPPGIAVGGAVKTESGNGVNNASVLLQSGASSLFDVTDDQGLYLFQYAVPYLSDYTLTPSKNTYHLDGVSTFDLVLISKHILGLQPLGSPYKMIAADANHSNTITTFDVVELRKLILGIYDSLPNNTSWRFIPTEFVFPDTTNPFLTPFPESIARTGAQADQLQEDFVGVKTGDVNNTAIGDPLLAPDDRSEAVLFFDVQNRNVEPGEVFTVAFSAAEKVLGYQFTLNINDLEFVEVSPGEGMTAANFAVFSDAVTASVETGAAGFAITFRAAKAGRLSEMLSISSRITRAEAYSPVEALAKAGRLANASMDVALRFNGQSSSSTSDTGFALYQNRPNPFCEKTSIGFYLPENTFAQLTVFDETGRILHTQSGTYPHGHNSISLEKSLFDRSGVLYYKLETATDCAVRKMMVVE